MDISKTASPSTTSIWKNIEHWITVVMDQIRWPAAIALFGMALLTTVDVIGRYVFDKPIKGNSEIQELIMVLIIFLGAGYCTIMRRHATADAIVVHFGRRLRASTDTITWFLSTITFGFISWQVTLWGLSQIANPTRVSVVLFIEHAPFIMVSALGCAAISLGSLINFIKAFYAAIGKGGDQQ